MPSSGGTSDIDSTDPISAPTDAIQEHGSLSRESSHHSDELEVEKDEHELHKTVDSPDQISLTQDVSPPMETTSEKDPDIIVPEAQVRLSIPANNTSLPDDAVHTPIQQSSTPILTPAGQRTVHLPQINPLVQRKAKTRISDTGSPLVNHQVRGNSLLDPRRHSDPQNNDTIIPQDESRGNEGELYIEEGDNSPPPRVMDYDSAKVEVEVSGQEEQNEEQDDEYDEYDEDDEDDDDYDDYDDYDEKLNLTLNCITPSLTGLFKRGNAITAMLTVGSRLIFGTQSGAIFVFVLPAFELKYSRQIFTDQVTGLSVSPMPTNEEISSELARGTNNYSGNLINQSRSTQSPAKRQTPESPFLAVTGFTSQVMIFPLDQPVNPIVRTFDKILYSVALSPDYKNDHMYITGGLNGDLVLTTGGRAGVPGTMKLPKVANSPGANRGHGPISSTKTGTGWMSPFFRTGNDPAQDHLLNENDNNGPITTISWSRSGKFVLWATGESFFVMRTKSKLPEAVSPEAAWSKIGYKARPEIAKHRSDDNDDHDSLEWVLRAEWVNEAWLEDDDYNTGGSPSLSDPESDKKGLMVTSKGPQKRQTQGIVTPERLVVGWGDTVWILVATDDVYADPKRGHKLVCGRIEITKTLQFPGYLISGLSFYTPSLLMILAHSKKSGLVLRLINTDDWQKIDDLPIDTKNAHKRTQSAFHLATTFFPSQQASPDPNNSVISAIIPGQAAFSAVSDTLWQAGPSAGRFLSSGASIFSQAGTMITATAGISTSNGSRAATPTNSQSPLPSSKTTPNLLVMPPRVLPSGLTSSLSRAILRPGLKVFLCGLHDVVMAVKPDAVDQLVWLIESERYEQAGNLLEENPQLVIPIDVWVGLKAFSSSSTGILLGMSMSYSESDGSVADDGSLAHTDVLMDDATSMGDPSPISQNIHGVSASSAKYSVGVLWMSSLVQAGDWALAGNIAPTVLRTRLDWEKWATTFATAGKYVEIVDGLPGGRDIMDDTATIKSHNLNDLDSKQGLHGSTLIILSPSVYTLFAIHYAHTDLAKLHSLVEKWGGVERLEPDPVITILEQRVKKKEIAYMSDDWRIVLKMLAPLYISQGWPTEALRCYLQLQDIDGAMELVHRERLLSEVLDDLGSFLLLRLPREEAKNVTWEVVEAKATESVQLLVDETFGGTVLVERVVVELGRNRDKNISVRGHVSSWRSAISSAAAKIIHSKSDKRPRLPIPDRHLGDHVQSMLLFMYFRALWRGNSSTNTRHHSGFSQVSEQGKRLVEEFADLAVELFAEFDPNLLLDLFKMSSRFDIDTAYQVCEDRKLFSELVFLMSKAGQAKKALYLIINRLNDIPRAIEFAKERNDPELWDSLLDYSMKQPELIRQLLTDIGTAIDPVRLVQRIPTQVEIPGLRESVAAMMKEYEIQKVMAEGAVNVLRAETRKALVVWKRGGRNGVRFDIEKQTPRSDNKDGSSSQPGTFSGDRTTKANEGSTNGTSKANSIINSHIPNQNWNFADDSPEILYRPRAGHCVECDGRLSTADLTSFIGFRCGHTHHLACILDRLAGQARRPGEDRGIESDGVNLTSRHLDIANPSARHNSHIHRTAAGMAKAMTSGSGGLGAAFEISNTVTPSPIMAANAVTAIGTPFIGANGAQSTSPIQSPIILPHMPILDVDDLEIGRARKLEDEIEHERGQMAIEAAVVVAAAGRKRRIMMDNPQQSVGRVNTANSTGVSSSLAFGARNGIPAVSLETRSSASVSSSLNNNGTGSYVGTSTSAASTVGHHPGVRPPPVSGSSYSSLSVAGHEIPGLGSGFDDVSIIPRMSGNKIEWAKSLKRTVMSAGCAVCVQEAQR